MTVFLRMLAEVLVKPLSQILWVALVGFLTQHWLLAFYHVGILSRVLLSQFDWSVLLQLHVGDKVLLQLHVGDKVGRDRPTEGEDGRHHHLIKMVPIFIFYHQDLYWVSQYLKIFYSSRPILGESISINILFIKTYIGRVNIFSNIFSFIFIKTYIGWVNMNITTATVEPALATMVPMHRERMNWKMVFY